MALTTPGPVFPVETAPSRSGTPVAVALVCVGLFTVSWDRFLAFAIGGYQLKIPTLAFLLALVCLAVDSASLQRWRMRPPVALVLALVVLAAEIPPLFWAHDKFSTVAELSAIVSKALVPLAATYFVAQAYGVLDLLLTAFIWGGYAAAVFGLYQLGAFYADLPQLVSYDALGGELGRISSFSYEAGYFGYFVVLVLGAIVARSYVRERGIPLLPVAFLVLVLVLTNSRAAFLTVPIFVALQLLRPLSRVGTSRLVVATLAVLTLGLFAAVSSPGVVDQVVDRARTITDPREVTSNAPRLYALRVAGEVVEDHQFGVGAGNFYQYARPYGLQTPDDTDPASLIVNNIWVQALVDGGWPLLGVEVVFSLVVILACFRRRHMAAKALIAGWISVMIVGGLITSYFFDTKLWVVLGLALAATRLQGEGTGGAWAADPDEEPTAWR